MYITARQFRPEHFAELQQFLGEARQGIERCHYLHPGDLTWQVFHMLAAHDPVDLLMLLRDEQRQNALAGFWLLYPDFGMFDIQYLPNFGQTILDDELRGGFFDDVLAGVQKQITALNPNLSALYTLVNEHDTLRKTQLEADGYTPQGDWIYMQHSLESLPEPEIPSSFKLADMTQADVESRANALANAFGGEPRPEHYRHFMKSPGYIAELDVVALASDGQVAAFAMCWLDPVSKTGPFEPVGTVPEFRGQGLGKAALLEGLRRMRFRGMKNVIVIVEAAEEPAVNLYTSVGFTPRWKIQLYGKTLASEH